MIASYMILKEAADRGDTTDLKTWVIVLLLIAVLAYVNSKLWYK